MCKKKKLKKLSSFYDKKYQKVFEIINKNKEFISFTDESNKYPLIMLMDGEIVLWHQKESVSPLPHIFTTEAEMILIISSVFSDKSNVYINNKISKSFQRVR